MPTADGLSSVNEIKAHHAGTEKLDVKWLILCLLILSVSCSERFSWKQADVTAGNQAAISSVTGAWESCNNYMGWSFKHSLALGTSNFMFNMTAFNVEDCVLGTEQFIETKMGSYTSNSSTLTVTIKTYNQVPLSNDDVTDKNNGNSCGFNDWVLNVPKLLNGVNCNGDTVNEGDVTTVDYTLTPSKLILTFPGNYTIEFTPLFDLVHENIGQSLADGNYIMVNGNLGIFTQVNGANYQTYIYDLAGRNVSAEIGTMTSSNNGMNYAMTGVLPIGCPNPGRTGTHTFTTNGDFFGLNIDGAGHNIMYLKTNMTEVLFRDHFLAGGFADNCM